jgi:hypothetical protein
MTGTVEIDPDARTIKYFNQENGRVFIHPSSLLFSAQSYSGAAAYLSYFTKMATSKVFIRDLTRMCPHPHPRSKYPKIEAILTCLPSFQPLLSPPLLRVHHP